MSKLILSLLLSLISFYSLPLAAQDITDEVTDVEEVTADSDAAKAEARALRARVEKERAENARELKNVRESRQAAEIKKQEAAQTLKKSEIELKRLASEATQLNKDIIRLNHETMVTERALTDAQARLDKSKVDSTALKATKAEKQAKLAELAKQQMQLMREVGLAEDQLAVEARDMERIAAEEKTAIEELEKARAEEVVRKVQAETKIKDLKEQIQALRTQRKALDVDVKRYKGYNRRLDEQMKVGAEELSNMKEPTAPKARTTSALSASE